MDDKAFKEFVQTHAQRFETETLMEIIEYLQGITNLRRAGKPPELKIGSNVEAIDLKYGTHSYGEVTQVRYNACMIRSPGSSYERKIAYKKHAIRVVDDRDWSWMENQLLERYAKVTAEIEQEHADRKIDIENAIAGRESAKRSAREVVMNDGSRVHLFRGAYVHAFREDHGHHLYGVVVQLNPKSCYIAPPTGDYDERIIYDKFAVVETLTEAQWEIVLAGWGEDETRYGAEIEI